MLDPAAPSEDHRRGAVTARRTHSRHARQAVRRGTAGGDCHRLRRRGHGRVHGGRGRRLLLPRDEHPAAGRTSGHRGHHRSRSGRPATAGRRRWPSRSRTAAVTRLLHRGPALRRGSRQGLAAAGRFGASLRRAHHHNAIRGARRTRACGSTPASRTVPRCRCSTTRCSPRSSPTRRHVVRPPDCWPTRWPAPAFTVCAPTATFSSTCCAMRRSSTAPPTRHSSTPTAWPNWPRRWPTHGPSSCRCSPPRWRMRPRIARRQRYSPPHPAAGATSRRASRPSATATLRARRTRSATASPAPVWNWPTSTR